MSQIINRSLGGGGTPIQNINGDTGTATGVTVNLNATPHAGRSTAFVAAGNAINLDVTNADHSTFIGLDAGGVSSTSPLNSSLGWQSLTNLLNASSGGSCAFGANAGSGLTSGSYSTFMGYNSGSLYTTESSNITIGYGNLGTAAESNTLRIGSATGTGNGQLNKAFICGINGINVGSVASVVSVSGNQLGSTTITAGSGITVTPGANTITIATNGTVTSTYVTVTNAQSPYTALTTDEYISADVTAGAVTIRLPNAPATGRSYVVKDKVGLSATNNVTITTVGGAVTIDGATTFVMNTAYEAANFIFNGTSYEIW